MRKRKASAKEKKIMDRDYEWSDVLLLDEKAREYEKQGDYAQSAEAYLECLKAFETCEISVYMSSVAEAGNKAEANFDRCIGLLSEGETRQKLCDQMDAFKSSLYGG